MTFRDDIGEEFGAILGGEFSSRIVFTLSDDSTVDTRGIFDDTYEEIAQGEGGAVVSGDLPRVVVYDAPDLVKGDLVTIYEDDDLTVRIQYKVNNVQPDSEGNTLIYLEVI